MIWVGAIAAIVVGQDAVGKLQHNRTYAAGLFEAIVTGAIVLGCIIAYIVRGDDD